MESRFETWKSINGYEDYQVSSFGRVRNVETKMFVKGVFFSYGSLIGVGLQKDGRRWYYEVHHLVGQEFIENPRGKPCIDHIDGNPLNNKVDNLRWATVQENKKWV
jgi:hypothetical protein